MFLIRSLSGAKVVKFRCWEWVGSFTGLISAAVFNQLLLVKVSQLHCRRRFRLLPQFGHFLYLYSRIVSHNHIHFSKTYHQGSLSHHLSHHPGHYDEQSQRLAFYSLHLPPPALVSSDAGEVISISGFYHTSCASSKRRLTIAV